MASPLLASVSEMYLRIIMIIIFPGKELVVHFDVKSLGSSRRQDGKQREKGTKAKRVLKNHYGGRQRLRLFEVGRAMTSPGPTVYQLPSPPPPAKQDIMICFSEQHWKQAATPIFPAVKLQLKRSEDTGPESPGVGTHICLPLKLGSTTELSPPNSFQR